MKNLTLSEKKHFITKKNEDPIKIFLDGALLIINECPNLSLGREYAFNTSSLLSLGYKRRFVAHGKTTFHHFSSMDTLLNLDELKDFYNAYIRGEIFGSDEYPLNPRMVINFSSKSNSLRGDVVLTPKFFSKRAYLIAKGIGDLNIDPAQTLEKILSYFDLTKLKEISS